MKLQAGNEFTSGMSGILGLWQGYFIPSVEHSTKAIFYGYSDDYKLSYEECDRILQLPVIQCSGGFLNREDSLEQEKYDKLYDEKLHMIQERILSQWREEKIHEQNKTLQEELQKLDKWLEEEIENISILYGNLDEKQKSVQNKIGTINRFSEKLKAKKQIADIEKHKSENQAEKRTLYQ